MDLKERTDFDAEKWGHRFDAVPGATPSIGSGSSLAGSSLTGSSSSRGGGSSLSSSSLSGSCGSSLLRGATRKSEYSIVRRGTIRISERAKSLMEELTMNKLDLKSLGLVGRDQEISTLRSRFSALYSQHETEQDYSTTTTATSELIFIQGYSGIGKSTLARSLRTDVDSSSNGVYIEGKYEFTSIDKPYRGIAQAFGDLCSKIFEDFSPEELAEVAKTIDDNIKEEAQMLSSLIPELSMISGGGSFGAILSSTNEHERWKHAFRMLTRTLCSHLSIVVMVLDDIQWADVSSLDILDSLISDVDNQRPLMIVGCYRSNEVDESSILYNRIQTLREKQEKFRFRITDIKLNNFDTITVNRIVMKILSIDDETQTQDLSTVCFKRTLGNPFFLLEFMKMLHAEELLEYNLGLMKWVWDVPKIEDATMSTPNVVDLLQTQMVKLPEDAQLLLQYAACLGSSFSLSTFFFHYISN